MGTLLELQGSALDLVDASEERFLSGAVSDAVRAAKRDGWSAARFGRYEIRAWREPLGARLVTVTWRVTRNEELVAGDTSILYA